MARPTPRPRRACLPAFARATEGGWGRGGGKRVEYLSRVNNCPRPVAACVRPSGRPLFCRRQQFIVSPYRFSLASCQVKCATGASAASFGGATASRPTLRDVWVRHSLPTRAATLRAGLSPAHATKPWLWPQRTSASVHHAARSLSRSLTHCGSPSALLLGVRPPPAFMSVTFFNISSCVCFLSSPRHSARPARSSWRRTKMSWTRGSARAFSRSPSSGGPSRPSVRPPLLLPLPSPPLTHPFYCHSLALHPSLALRALCDVQRPHYLSPSFTFWFSDPLFCPSSLH